MRSTGKNEHNELMAKMVEHRTHLQRMDGGLEKVHKEISQTRRAVHSQYDALGDAVAHAAQASRHHFDHISLKVDEANSSVMSMRSTGEQIIGYLRNFPHDLRELLQKIIQGNWQMYRVLLQIQNNTARSPSGLLESNIRFEDALGDYRE